MKDGTAWLQSRSELRMLHLLCAALLHSNTRSGVSKTGNASIAWHWGTFV